MKKNLIKNFLMIMTLFLVFFVSGCAEGVVPSEPLPILKDVTYVEGMTLKDVELPEGYEWKNPSQELSVNQSKYIVLKVNGNVKEEHSLKLTVNKGTVSILKEPSLDESKIVINAVVPEIIQGEANTKGSFEWVNKEQVVLDGENTFLWVFNPDSENYDSVTGSISLTKYDPFGPHEVIKGLANYKKASYGLTEEENLFENPEFLKSVGTTGGDWVAFGFGRAGVEDYYDGYLDAVQVYVAQKYDTPNKLDRIKATEWHRIIYAIAALGGDPTHQLTLDRQNIDLVADGTYNRGLTKPIDAQGMNGYIFGLLALDAGAYEVPTDAFNTREDFIVNLLKFQLADGGFALWGANADTDITGMAIQALARYYNSEKEYTYESNSLVDEAGNKLQVTKTVRQAIDEAVECLSKMQLPSAGFGSWGTENCESIAQVITALTSVNIDLTKDERFIKDGKTLYDAIIAFRMEDGGFAHVLSGKPASNQMASDQALYAIAAFDRCQKHMRALYDMLPELTKDEQNEINKVIVEISKLSASSTLEEVQSVLNMYLGLPFNNRRYVTNYWDLSSLIKTNKIDLPSDLLY